MRIHLLVIVFAVAMAAAARAGDVDTLYLRDGSVVNGTAARRESGDWQVRSRFGVLNINAADVVYVRQRVAPPPVIEESHFFIDETTRTLSVVMQDAPARTDESAAFNLLMPGEVESVVTDSGAGVRFSRRQVGDHCLISVDYDSVPAAAKRIRIVLWQDNLLERGNSKTARFQRKYIPDREGTILITIKYPREWKVRSAEPRPESLAEGLIVWRRQVGREQEFAPDAVFETAK